MRRRNFLAAAMASAVSTSPLLAAMPGRRRPTPVEPKGWRKQCGLRLLFAGGPWDKQVFDSMDREWWFPGIVRCNPKKPWLVHTGDLFLSIGPHNRLYENGEQMGWEEGTSETVVYRRAGITQVNGFSYRQCDFHGYIDTSSRKYKALLATAKAGGRGRAMWIADGCLTQAGTPQKIWVYRG